MGSVGVPKSPPTYDYDLGLAQRIEDFTVQNFIAHLPTEALALSVLPRRSRLYVCDLGPDSLNRPGRLKR